MSLLRCYPHSGFLKVKFITYFFLPFKVSGRSIRGALVVHDRTKLCYMTHMNGFLDQMRSKRHFLSLLSMMVSRACNYTNTSKV